MKKTDICIIGAGPAGIFTALELLRQNSKKRIVIVEKGKPVEKRKCPKAETKECINCRPYCNITTGFSGAGAFSDGKLSLSMKALNDVAAEEIREEKVVLLLLRVAAAGLLYLLPVMRVFMMIAKLSRKFSLS